MKQIATLTVIAALGTALTAAAEIQTAKGGALNLLTAPRAAVATAVETATLTPTDVMPCPKCHNELTTYVTTSRGGVREYRTVAQHVCPGCRTSIEAVGHGKAKTERVIHTCTASKEPNCCSMK